MRRPSGGRRSETERATGRAGQMAMRGRVERRSWMVRRRSRGGGARARRRGMFVRLAWRRSCSMMGIPFGKHILFFVWWLTQRYARQFTCLCAGV